MRSSSWSVVSRSMSPDGGGAAQAPHAVAGVVHAVVSFRRAEPGRGPRAAGQSSARARSGLTSRAAPGGAARARRRGGSGARPEPPAPAPPRRRRAPTRGRAAGRAARASRRRGRAPWRPAWASARRRPSTRRWRRRGARRRGRARTRGRARVARRLSTSLALASRTQAELSPARRFHACSGRGGGGGEHEDVLAAGRVLAPSPLPSPAAGRRPRGSRPPSRRSAPRAAA